MTCFNNTTATFSNSVDDLITDFQKESENATDWFRWNEMIVNPDKFQSITINNLGKLNNSYELLINNHKIDLENSVIKVDNLNFEEYVTTLYQKAGHQLNVLSRIQKYIQFQKRKMLLNSFILSNFNYCPPVWHFCSAALSQKIEKLRKLL